MRMLCIERVRHNRNEHEGNVVLEVLIAQFAGWLIDEYAVISISCRGNLSPQSKPGESFLRFDQKLSIDISDRPAILQCITVQ